jgi:MFS family permease
VVFPVLSGMLIDKIGVRKAGLIFGFGVFLAQLAVTATIYWRSDLMEETDRSTTWYYMLLLSRAVFGVCGENIHIVQAAMISIVIPTERLSLVLGLCMSVPLMFTSLNSLISTWVYDTTK